MKKIICAYIVALFSLQLHCSETSPTTPKKTGLYVPNTSGSGTYASRHDQASSSRHVYLTEKQLRDKHPKRPVTYPFGSPFKTSGTTHQAPCAPGNQGLRADFGTNLRQ